MSLEQSPSGKWRGEAGVNGHRRKTRAVATRKEAIRLEAELRIVRGDAQVIARPGRKTIDDICADFLTDRQRARDVGRASPATVDVHTAAVRAVPADFARRPASNVGVEQVEDLYDQLARRGVSSHQVRQVHVMLQGAFAMAVRRSNRHMRNPMLTVKQPLTPPSTVTPPTPDQVRALFAATDHPTHRLMLHLAAATGARRGELCGLEWDMVDVDQRRVMFARSLVEAADGTVTVGATKTGNRGHRTLELDGALVELLTEQRRIQVAKTLRSVLGSARRGGCSASRPVPNR